MRPLIDPQLFYREQTDHLETAEEKIRNFQRLFGRHSHARNEQPFFGILDGDLETLTWSAGGKDLHAILHTNVCGQKPITSLSGLFQRLGIDQSVRLEVQQEMAKLNDGASMSFINRLTLSGGRTFSIVFTHRDDEPQGAIQFTLYDLAPFIETEKSVSSMASYVLQQLTEASDGGRSDIERLHDIQTGAGKLLLLSNDDDIRVQAESLVADVETLASRTIDILQGFEAAEPEAVLSTGQVKPLECLSNALPGHTQIFGEWPEVLERIEAIVSGEQYLSAVEAHHLYFADSFIRNAQPLMIYTTEDNTIYVLNGEKRGEVYNDVDVMVRDIGVEEVSRRSASDFFASKKDGATTLSINNQNAEVRGMTTPDGGWQIMIMPAMTQSIDVRGLFHAFKNLLLNLQVLHVVKTRDDTKAIGTALMDTLASIKVRVESLRYLAKHGHAHQSRSAETVAMWIDAANRITGSNPTNISVSGLAETGHLAFRIPPGEMEDSLIEVIQNALTHGAENIAIELSIDHHRLIISVSDDGNGISQEKLEQIRKVIETRRHDATLTTRSDGSGHGLLGAANVLSHFIGGQLEIDHNPTGQGTQVRLGMNLPSKYL